MIIYVCLVENIFVLFFLLLFLKMKNRFDSGWIVKIGRGLDYIRRPEHKFCGLGVHDYDFRTCSATTIDIFHSSILRQDT